MPQQPPKWTPPPRQEYSLLSEKEWRLNWKRGINERPESRVEPTYWGGVLWTLRYPEGRVAINDFSKVKVLLACCVLDPEYPGPASADAVRRFAAPRVFMDHYGRFYWPGAGAFGGGFFGTVLTAQMSDSLALLAGVGVTAVAAGGAAGRWIERSVDRDARRLRLLPLSSEASEQLALTTELLLAAVHELERAQTETSQLQMTSLRDAMRRALWELTQEEEPESEETIVWADLCKSAIEVLREIVKHQDPDGTAIAVEVVSSVLSAGPAGDATRTAVNELTSILDDLVARRDAARAQDEQADEPIHRAQAESRRQRREEAQASITDAIERSRRFRSELADDIRARNEVTRELRDNDSGTDESGGPSI